MRHADYREPPGAARAKIGRDGLVIPLAFREALGIRGGDEIVMSRKDDDLCGNAPADRLFAPRVGWVIVLEFPAFRLELRLPVLPSQGKVVAR